MQGQRRYALRFLIPHLAAQGQYGRLFHALEETPFLSWQAESFDSFSESLRNLEEQALPVSIELQDWRRFAHFFLIAINIRSLSRSFSDKETLKAIIQRNRTGLVLDAVAEADIHFRLFGRGLALHGLDRDGELFASLLRKIREDLRVLPPPRDEIEAERQFLLLVGLVTRVGPQIETEISLLLTTRPAWADRIWAAVAGGYLEQGGLLDPGFWTSLAKVEDADLLGVLPDLFADEEVDVSWEALHQVAALEKTDVRVLSLCWASLVGRTAQRDPEAARFAWDRVVETGSFEWSLELVERARGLFAAADSAWIEKSVARAADPLLAAVLWIFAARRGDAAARAKAEECLGRLPQGPDRIHWTLSLLETGPAPDLPDRLRRLAGSLRSLRFAVPDDDLRRFLDLVARALPHELEQTLEEVVWAPSTGPDLLITLAEKSGELRLLEALFANVDACLAAFGPSEMDGYWALKEIVPRVAGRLCALRGDLVHLDAALRQAPDPDEACVTIAKTLAAAGHHPLVEKICDGIGSKRLRLQTFFDLLPDKACERYLKDPATLYASLAVSEACEDVVLGLMTLLDPGRPLASPRETSLLPITQENERVIAALQRSRFALDHPERFGWTARNLAQEAEGLARAAGALSSDLQLAFLTPDLLEVWGRIDPEQACEELRESLRQILGLRFLTPENRHTAVEVLLSRMHLLLFPSTSKSKAVPRSRYRDAASLVLWLAGELAAPPQEPASSDHRDLLPVLVAAASRLPRPALDSLGPGGLLRLLTVGGSPDAPQDGRVRILSCALQEDPRKAIAQWLEEDDSEPLALVGLIYLLAVQHPDLALEAIHLLSANPSRDGLCLRLIGHGWLPDDPARWALDLIEDPSVRLDAELRLGARSSRGADAETWVTLLARLAAEKDVDSSDPSNEILIRHLWSAASPDSHAVLAQAARAALTGDPFLAWGTFYLWLHSLLSPLPAEKSAERLRLAEDLLASLPKALRLPSDSPEIGASVSGG